MEPFFNADALASAVCANRKSAVCPVPIPPWDARQVLPPIDDSDPVSFARSPYPVSLVEFVRRFSTSWKRCTILQGYLLYRSELQAAGVLDGFQWIDGSFLENIEALEQRSPSDVDVVTFFTDPTGQISAAVPPNLGDHDWVKANRHVDSYFVEMSQLPPEMLIEQSTYWYSMWSHRRNKTWKGYLHVDLAPAEDAAANQELTNRIALFPAPAAPQPAGRQP